MWPTVGAAATVVVRRNWTRRAHICWVYGLVVSGMVFKICVRLRSMEFAFLMKTGARCGGSGMMHAIRVVCWLSGWSRGLLGLAESIMWLLATGHVASSSNAAGGMVTTVDRAPG